MQDLFGGIVGTSYCTISYCYNKGTISTPVSYAGGIIGNGDYNSSYVTNNKEYLNISYCYNTGDIVSSNSYVGGIAGKTQGNISNTYNEGNITGTTYSAGIVGYTTSTLSYSYNVGKQINGTGSIGGIIGYQYGSSTDVLNCSYCYNTSEVVGTSQNVGGIVGISSYSTINYSYNLGNIGGSSSTYVGGIVGRFSGAASTLVNCSYCYNTGDVIGNKYIGGIAGYNSNSTINYSYNLGNIGDSSSTYVGGITGQNFNTSSTIQNCINVGNVKGKENDTSIGAITGYSSSTTATGLTNCGYLQGTAEWAAGRAKLDTGASVLTSAPPIINTVGTTYYRDDTTGINNGYPVLAWQLE